MKAGDRGRARGRLPLLRRGQGRRGRASYYDSVPQARLVARAAARPDVHLPPLRAAHRAGPRGRRASTRASTAPRTTTWCCVSTERARRVVHVPEVLYHWRAVAGSAAADPDAKPYAWIAGRKAVQAHMDRIGIRPRPSQLGPRAGHLPARAAGSTPTSGSASSSRPAAATASSGGSGARSSSRRCARCCDTAGARQPRDRGRPRHRHPAYVLDELREVGGARLHARALRKAFNFSEKCNLGVVASYGDVVVLLNDDIEIASENFIAEPGRAVVRATAWE